MAIVILSIWLSLLYIVGDEFGDIVYGRMRTASMYCIIVYVLSRMVDVITLLVLKD